MGKYTRTRYPDVATEKWQCAEDIKAGDIVGTYGPGGLVVIADPARKTTAGVANYDLNGQQRVGKLAGYLRDPNKLGGAGYQGGVPVSAQVTLSYTPRNFCTPQTEVCDDGNIVHSYFVQNGADNDTADIRFDIINHNNQTNQHPASGVLVASSALVNRRAYAKWTVPLEGTYTNSTNISRFAVAYALNEKTSNGITNVIRPYVNIYDSTGTLLSKTAIAADVNTLWDQYSLVLEQLPNGRMLVMYRGISDPTNTGSVLNVYYSILNADGSVNIALTAVPYTDSNIYLQYRAAKNMQIRATAAGNGGWGALLIFALNSSPYNNQVIVPLSFSSTGSLQYPNSNTVMSTPFDGAGNPNNLVGVMPNNITYDASWNVRVFKLSMGSWGWIATSNDYSAASMYFGTYDATGNVSSGEINKLSGANYIALNTLSRSGMSFYYPNVTGLAQGVSSAAQTTIADMSIKEIAFPAVGVDGTVGIVFKCYCALQGKWLLGSYFLDNTGRVLSRADASAPLWLGGIVATEGNWPPRIAPLYKLSATNTPGAYKSAYGFIQNGDNADYIVYGASTTDISGESLNYVAIDKSNKSVNANYVTSQGSQPPFTSGSVTINSSICPYINSSNPYNPISVIIKHNKNPLGYKNNIRPNQYVISNLIIVTNYSASGYADYPTCAVTVMTAILYDTPIKFIGVALDDGNIGEYVNVQVSGSAVLSNWYTGMNIDSSAQSNNNYNGVLNAFGGKATVSGNLLTFL